MDTIWALASRVHHVPGNMCVQFRVATKATLKQNISEVVRAPLEFHREQRNASFKLWTMNKSMIAMV